MKKESDYKWFCIGSTILIVLIVGEPDLLDAIINYVMNAGNNYE